jgi:cation diffusion facilitator family transporter
MHTHAKSNEKEKVALSSVFAGALLTLTKLVVGLLTGSMGIVAEAAHSSLDFLSAIITFFAVKIGDQPADKKHHFGHQKIESVSALIATGLLFLTSAWIVFEAIKRLLSHNTEVEITWYAFAVIILSIIVDISRSRALYKVAKKTKSQALEADALHFNSDIYSSLVVLAGLILSILGVNMADSFAAIAVSLFILKAGWDLGKRTIDTLTDAAPEGISEEIEKNISKVAGVVLIEKLRIRPVGPVMFIDVTVFVARNKSSLQIKDICNQIEAAIHGLTESSDITIHTKPIALDNESINDQIELLAKSGEMNAHNISIHKDGAKTHLSFDVEIRDEMSIAEAHDKVEKLETELKIELGENFSILIHPEPAKQSLNVDKRKIDEKKYISFINSAADDYPEIKGVHKIELRYLTNKQIFASFHCLFEKKTALRKSHEICSQLEKRLRANADIFEVMIHAEPVA